MIMNNQHPANLLRSSVIGSFLRRHKFFLLPLLYSLALIFFVTQLNLYSSLPPRRILQPESSSPKNLITPTVIVPEAWVQIKPNEQFSFQMSKTLFSNPLGAPMQYKANLLGETVLPDWINFREEQIAFDGRAPKKGNFSIQINAQIVGHPSSSMVLRLIVANEPPIIQTPSDHLTVEVGEPFVIQIQVNDPNDDFLTQNLTQVGQGKFPVWLKYDNQTYSLSGVPNINETYSLRLTVSDGDFNISKEFHLDCQISDTKSTDIFHPLILVEGTGTEWEIPSAIFKSPEVSVTEVIFNNGEDYTKWLTVNKEEKKLIFYHRIGNSKPLNIDIQLSDGSSHPFSFNLRNINPIVTVLKREQSIGSTYTKTGHYAQIFKANGDIISIWEDLQTNLNFLIHSQSGHLIEDFRPHFDAMDSLIFRTAGPEVDGALPIFFERGGCSMKPRGLYVLNMTDIGNRTVSNPITVLDEDSGLSVREMILLSDNSWLIRISNNSACMTDETYGVTYDPFKGAPRVFLKTMLKGVEKSFESPDQNFILTSLSSGILMMDKYTKEMIHISQFRRTPFFHDERIFAYDLATISEDRFVVTWVEAQNSLSTHKKLYAQFMDSNLHNINQPFLVYEFKTDSNLTVQVSNLKDGRLIFSVELNDQRLDQSKFGFVILDLATLKTKPWMEIHRRIVNQSSKPIMSILPSNNLHFSWTYQVNETQFYVVSTIISSVFMRNYAPDLIGHIPDQKIMGGESFVFSISNGLFTDQDGDYLFLQAKLSDGSPLPEWLNFEGPIGEFSVDTRPMLEGIYEIVVTARDSNFASVNTSFLLIVENDPGKYVFGFILLFILLFVFGVIIKDFIVDRLQDHHEPTDDVFIDDEEDIVEQFELEAQFQQQFNSPVIVSKEDLERFMNNQTDKIPKMFLCPITGEIISDPWVVVTENGGTCHSYEKEAIETWMKNHDTDPLTRHKRKSVGCNISLKHAIELYLNQLKVEELRNDPGLLSEVENWIRRRGGIEKLREDSNMHNLVRNVEQVKESKSADSSVELKHDEQFVFFTQV